LKPDIDSDEEHPQLSDNRHLVDGVLVGTGGGFTLVMEKCLNTGQKW
jgi:hypothetical protein